MDGKALALGLMRSKTAWGGVGQWLLAALLASLDSGRPLGIWIGQDQATATGYFLSVPAVLFAVATGFLGLVLWGRKTASGPLGEAAGQVTAGVGEEPCSYPFPLISHGILAGYVSPKFEAIMDKARQFEANSKLRPCEGGLSGVEEDTSKAVETRLSCNNDPLGRRFESLEKAKRELLQAICEKYSCTEQEFQDFFTSKFLYPFSDDPSFLSKNETNYEAWRKRSEEASPSGPASLRSSARTSPAFGGVARDWAGQAQAAAPAAQVDPVASPEIKPEGGQS